ncbi:glycosyltransferase family 39 protein [Antrihabitans sp. YC2-6]|uniref:glycosyltransferase family 39 protein n=1 Tax=Antrihabitans sp. YC2-6 TaxID=2799498 RepID=UPI0018F730AE|nr:glycosyltransferase family 39 protein [Antrihabitans sp. YC2-6]MBJ8346203.1 glycosyltransferase family 39 protein [Antrihabitans sp. YC2-6]
MAASRTRGIGSALSVGLLAALLGSAFSWRPSYWYDEAATVFASQRRLPDLWRLLDHQDAVHGLYYLGMHLWFRLVGESEFTARLPSAIAVGAAAAGVVVLGRELANPRVGLLAGLAFAILPRVTWAAVEVRSFAATTTAAVWLTVAMLVAVRRGRWWWLLYAVGVALSLLLFLDLAALVAAHGVTVALIARRASIMWAVAALGGAIVALPAVRLITSQSGQVAWIPPLDRHFVRALAEYQWFVGAPLFALSAAILLVGAVYVARSVRSDLVAVALPWALVPTALIACYSLFVEPIYLDRYLTFTAPAVALLLGSAIAVLARARWVAPAVLAVLVATAAPAYVAQRGEWSKPSQMDFSAVLRFFEEHGEPGDCVLFANRVDWNPTSARVPLNIRPAAFAGLRDPGAGRSATANGWLWDENLPVALVRLDDCDVVWFVGDGERESASTVRHTSNEVWHLDPYHFESSADGRLLAAAGFVVDERWQLHVSQVVRLTRAVP